MFHLYGITNANAYLSEQLEDNVKSLFSWGFLEAGFFTNITIPTSGIDGGDFSRLRRSSENGYTAGQVWEGVRKDWVWETGLSYHAEPIHFSGVFVNSTFQPATGTGPYAFNVDYPNGRIVFDSAISTSATVKAEYSYRTCSFTTSQEFTAHYKRDIQFDSFHVEDSQFLQVGSGQWDQSPRKRLQLPAVIVESQPKTRRTPFELGNHVHETDQYVVLHLLSETNFDYKVIHDLITYQHGTRPMLFDKNAAVAATGYGLNFTGAPYDSTLMYPDLIKPQVDGGYAWKQMRFVNITSNGSYSKFPLIYCPIESICRVNIP